MAPDLVFAGRIAAGIAIGLWLAWSSVLLIQTLANKSPLNRWVSHIFGYVLLVVLVFLVALTVWLMALLDSGYDLFASLVLIEAAFGFWWNHRAATRRPGDDLSFGGLTAAYIVLLLGLTGAAAFIYVSNAALQSGEQPPIWLLGIFWAALAFFSWLIGKLLYHYFAKHLRPFWIALSGPGSDMVETETRKLHQAAVSDLNEFMTVAMHDRDWFKAAALVGTMNQALMSCESFLEQARTPATISDLEGIRSAVSQVTHLAVQFPDPLEDSIPSQLKECRDRAGKLAEQAEGLQHQAWEHANSNAQEDLADEAAANRLVGQIRELAERCQRCADDCEQLAQRANLPTAYNHSLNAQQAARNAAAALQNAEGDVARARETLEERRQHALDVVLSDALSHLPFMSDKTRERVTRWISEYSRGLGKDDLTSRDLAIERLKGLWENSRQKTVLWSCNIPGLVRDVTQGRSLSKAEQEIVSGRLEDIEFEIAEGSATPTVLNTATLHDLITRTYAARS